MAFFGVTKEVIHEVKDHPNADRLDICRLKNLDFQFVTGKGLRKEGDEVLYFPIDSLLPQEITDAMELTGKLAGSNKNRIKTMKLRGEISQGVIGSLDMINGMTEDQTPENITKFLGVEKWEPEPVFSNSGNLLPLPDGCSKYDIEGCERYGNVLEDLKDKEVYVTEKLEGTNFSVLIDEKDEVKVNQRNYTIEEIDGKINAYWETARDGGLIDCARWIKKEYKYESVVIYGEMIGSGVQGNYYKLKQREVRVFDIKVDGKWLDKKEMYLKLASYNTDKDIQINTAPIIYNGLLGEYLGTQTVKEVSNGPTLMDKSGRLREGVVITPAEETFSYDLSGRLIIKQRSPMYLAKTDN
jgi:RNA ligase (TIGR02306 family)